IHTPKLPDQHHHPPTHSPTPNSERPDLNIQLRFAASVDLARFIGVSETEILHNEAEIDDFFL
uniref:hypothetical protein n=1 Tax=Bifidobacterium longum TaxID=216816 RepID=UPI00359C7CC1